MQAREIDGDYYDFLELGQERLRLVVGDISGKGTAAALLMANLQANLRSQLAIATDQPQRFLQSVNRLFYGNTNDSVYAPLFFAEYDDKAHRLRYANCGHLSLFLLRRGQTVERLESTGTVLGLSKEWECSIEERRLFSGDTLLLYTDGITESFNDAGEEFGERRLIDALLRHQGLGSEASLNIIIYELRIFSAREQHDDHRDHCQMHKSVMEQLTIHLTRPCSSKIIKVPADKAPGSRATRNYLAGSPAYLGWPATSSSASSLSQPKRITAS